MITALLLCQVLAGGSSGATSIDPLTLEQLVHQASFVAVVECDVAGGIIARYKVLEPIKGGVEAGKEFNLRTAVNYWEPQFPITLVKQRFLVTAFASPPPLPRLLSTGAGGGVPLWWRNLPEDFRLPLFQGKYPIQAGERGFSVDFDQVAYADLESFVRKAKEFVASSPEAQEWIALKSVARKVFKRQLHSKDQALASVFEEILKTVHATKDIATLVEALLKSLDRLPPAHRFRVVSILSQGGKATGQVFRALPQGGGPLTPNERKDIEEELAPVEPEEPREQKADVLPTAEELRAHREGLVRKGRLEEPTFEVLAKYDPAPVAEYLVRWKNTGDGWWARDAGYVLASSFAVLCGKDRPLHFRALLKAAEPFVQVAGAVYLAMEDEKEGVEELKKLSVLEGDPGVWAALTLARRGHGYAMPRALEVFREYGSTAMDGVPHRNLQKRLQVLLSNSAHASGVEPPTDPDQDDRDSDLAAWSIARHKSTLDWWKANRSKIRLSDPWLPALIQQKID